MRSGRALVWVRVRVQPGRAPVRPGCPRCASAAPGAGMRSAWRGGRPAGRAGAGAGAAAQPSCASVPALALELPGGAAVPEGAATPGSAAAPGSAPTGCRTRPRAGGHGATPRCWTAGRRDAAAGSKAPEPCEAAGRAPGAAAGLRGARAAWLASAGWRARAAWSAGPARAAALCCQTRCWQALCCQTRCWQALCCRAWCWRVSSRGTSWPEARRPGTRRLGFRAWRQRVPDRQLCAGIAAGARDVSWWRCSKHQGRDYRTHPSDDCPCSSQTPRSLSVAQCHWADAVPRPCRSILFTTRRADLMLPKESEHVQRAIYHFFRDLPGKSPTCGYDGKITAYRA
jgi:hypothetical protein